MALKTRKPNFASADAGEQIAALIAYVEELTEEVEFRFDVLSEATEKLKRMCAGKTEGSE